MVSIEHVSKAPLNDNNRCSRKLNRRFKFNFVPRPCRETADQGENEITIAVLLFLLRAKDDKYALVN